MIQLPDNPAPAACNFTLIDFGSTLRPQLGGAEQRINRGGSKVFLSVTMPPMENREQGRKFVSRLIRAKSEGLRMDYPLGGIEVGNPGAPETANNNQIGSVLALTGFTPGYQLKEGQPFSIIDSNGYSYLHFIAEDATVDIGGSVSASIYPPLRELFNIGASCNFLQPVIEGVVDGDDTEWSLSVDHILEISFGVRERK